MKQKLNANASVPEATKQVLNNKKTEIIRAKKVTRLKSGKANVKSASTKENKKQKAAHILNPKILDDISSNLVKLTKEYTELLNSTICNNLTMANIRTELTEDMLNYLVTSISTRMQHSVGFVKELIKCKDIKDVQSLQQQMLEMYFPLVINSNLSLVRNLQKFEYNRKPGAKK